MGNGGSTPQPYVQPPPNPIPFEDSIAIKKEAALEQAKRAGGASRESNDLQGNEADNQEAVTRKQIAAGENFAPQPQPRGPAGRRVRGPTVSPGSMSRSGSLTTSAILTG